MQCDMYTIIPEDQDGYEEFICDKCSAVLSKEDEEEIERLQELVQELSSFMNVTLDILSSPLTNNEEFLNRLPALCNKYIMDIIELKSRIKESG